MNFSRHSLIGGQLGVTLSIRSEIMLRPKEKSVSTEQVHVMCLPMGC